MVEVQVAQDDIVDVTGADVELREAGIKILMFINKLIERNVGQAHRPLSIPPVTWCSSVGPSGQAFWLSHAKSLTQFVVMPISSAATKRMVVSPTFSRSWMANVPSFRKENLVSPTGNS